MIFNGFVVIDGGNKRPPRPQEQRCDAARLTHSTLTVRVTEERANGRRYSVVMRDWKGAE